MSRDLTILELLERIERGKTLAEWQEDSDTKQALHEVAAWIEAHAPLQGTQDALQGLREALSEVVGVLVDRLDLERDNDQNAWLCKSIDSDNYGDPVVKYTHLDLPVYDKVRALLSSSTLQAGGWNYDMEAAPKDKEVYLAFVGRNGQPRSEKAHYTDYSDLEPDFAVKSGWFHSSMGYRIDPYAWHPVQEKPAAPLPVSDKGAAK